MGLHLRKCPTGLPTWAYIYENIQQGCLHRICQGIFNLDKYKLKCSHPPPSMHANSHASPLETQL
jgi:hypothetical protein